jgi:hypothetical protein
MFLHRAERILNVRRQMPPLPRKIEHRSRDFQHELDAFVPQVALGRVGMPVWCYLQLAQISHERLGVYVPKTSRMLEWLFVAYEVQQVIAGSAVALDRRDRRAKHMFVVIEPALA